MIPKVNDMTLDEDWNVYPIQKVIDPNLNKKWKTKNGISDYENEISHEEGFRSSKKHS